MVSNYGFVNDVPVLLGWWGSFSGGLEFQKIKFFLRCWTESSKLLRLYLSFCISILHCFKCMLNVDLWRHLQNAIMQRVCRCFLFSRTTYIMEYPVGEGVRWYIIIPPPNEVGGGVILDSPCPSVRLFVRPSVRLSIRLSVDDMVSGA